MARISDLHKKWLKEPKYRKAYEALEEEFVLASAVIDARNRAGLTQQELAKEDGDYTAGRSAFRKRARSPVDADTGASGYSDQIAVAYQF